MILWRWVFGFFRLLTQSVLLALTQIWANKTRSILTTIGVIIGVASVTAVIAALTGLQAKVLKDLENIGTNKIFVYPRRPDTGPKRNINWWEIRFKPHEFDDFLQHCPSIPRFTRIMYRDQSVRSAQQKIDKVSVQGVDASWHEVDNRKTLLGRPFTLLDEQQAHAVCLITEKLRDKLRLDRDCVGQVIYIENMRYYIVGVVEPPARMDVFGGEGEDHYEAYVPFSTLWHKYPEWFQVIAMSKSPEFSDEARAEIKFYLRQQRRLAPDEPDTFDVETVESFVRQFNEIAAVITLVAVGVVSISLLVGGVGIMNIMLVSVSERTREIGLRKAVGARPSAILLQFLVEAVILCFIGGMVGIALGGLLTSLLTHVTDKLNQAHIPGWAIALSFGFAALVGIFFGMFPAVKAARLDPIEALRHE